MGIQATGKSTFFRETFFHSHIRINLDMLRTRHREALLLQACIEMKQPFVVDNTNVTHTERQRYIHTARKAGFSIVGYYFQSKLNESIQRNSLRQATQKIPDVGIRSTFAKLELPWLDEGFDELYYVRIDKCNKFKVEEWEDEV